MNTRDLKWCGTVQYYEFLLEISNYNYMDETQLYGQPGDATINVFIVSFAYYQNDKYVWFL